MNKTLTNINTTLTNKEQNQLAVNPFSKHSSDNCYKLLQTLKTGSPDWCFDEGWEEEDSEIKSRSLSIVWG